MFSILHRKPEPAPPEPRELRHCLNCFFEPDWHFVEPISWEMKGSCQSAMFEGKDPVVSRSERGTCRLAGHYTVVGFSFSPLALAAGTITNCPVWEPKEQETAQAT